MADFIIENITEEEEEKLNQHPEIEWYIDDVLLSRDIVVNTRSDAMKVLKIIGRNS